MYALLFAYLVYIALIIETYMYKVNIVNSPFQKKQKVTFNIPDIASSKRMRKS